MNKTNEVILESERLVMRRPTKDDANAIFNSYASDPDVTKYLTFTPHKTLQDTYDFIKWSDEQWEKRSYCFVIVSKEDERIMGGIGLEFAHGTSDDARIGYCLAKNEWGKGYATEACKRIVEFAKESGVGKLVAPMHPENKASIRVVEKCGFQEDSESGEMLLLPNLGEEVKLVGLCRSLSMSVPPPDLIWEG